MVNTEEGRADMKAEDTDDIMEPLDPAIPEARTPGIEDKKSARKFSSVS